MDEIFSRPRDRRGWFLLWGLTSAVLMAFGALGPWARIVPFGRGAVERHPGALLVLAAAVVGASLLVAWRQRRGAGIAALVAGLVGLAVTHHARSHPALSLGVRFLGPRFIHVGWGLHLASLASLSLALCGFVWLLALPDSPEPGRFVGATPPAG